MLKALNLLRPSKNEAAVVAVEPEIGMIECPDVLQPSENLDEDFGKGETTIKSNNADERPNDDLDEIYGWMDRIPFSRPRKNFARDFSDGVLMAELLKHYYPRYVDLHNYMSRNSVAHKIDNWSTINRKVLSKIGMKLGKDVIKKLANSEPGAVESFLVDLRAKIIKDSNADRESLYSDYDDTGKGETIKSALNPEELANKTVPRRAFVRLKNELQEKKSVISTLSEKISHLESLMKLKDQRIADLSAQITGSFEKIGTPRSNIYGNVGPKNRTN